MKYIVHTLDARHLLAQVTVEAADPDQARRQVEAEGAQALSVTPEQTTRWWGARRAVAGTRGFSLLLFSQELLALLQAGLSIVESLEALLEKNNQPGPRQVLTRLLSALREGQRLSSAMAAQGELFPQLYVGVVRTAEGTSDLPRALGRFIDYQQRIDMVRGKLISAAIYPSILLLVGGGVSLFLIGYVVPRFAEVYQGSGRSLPYLSQLLLQWGQFAGQHSAIVVLGVAGAVAAVVILVGRAGGPGALLARLPVLRERVRLFELSRLYLTLGLLLEGGFPVVEAMRLTAEAATPALRTRLCSAQALIEAGQPMSAAFDAQELTTVIALRMLRVGERTGQMGHQLMQAANFHDGDIGRWIERFMRGFEPLLMAVIGLVVGVIVVLLYMPIFDLAGSF
jgi:general secretion pathway protein F